MRKLAGESHGSDGELGWARGGACLRLRAQHGREPTAAELEASRGDVLRVELLAKLGREPTESEMFAMAEEKLRRELKAMLGRSPTPPEIAISKEKARQRWLPGRSG